MRRIKHILPYIVMYGVAFLWMIPILWMVDTAFKPDDEIFSSPPKWIPSHFTLDHVKEVIMEWPFLKWLLQSVIVATTVTFGSLIVSTLAAYSFARLQWRGRDFLFIFFLIFMLLPFELNVIPLFFQMSKFGWLNTVPGVALPMIAMPIGVFLLRQFFINIPRELEDAARIDGCSSFGILWKVIVPISKPVFGAFGMFMFNMAWNEFFWSIICLQKSDLLTLPVGLRHLHGAFDINYGLFMAAAFMASLPSLFIFLILRRQIIRGFTLAGAGMKG